MERVMELKSNLLDFFVGLKEKETITKKSQGKWILALKHIVLIIIGGIMAFPLLWMIMGAFKTNYEIWNEPSKLLPNSFDVGIFAETLTSSPFIPYIANSLFTSVIATFIVLINSAMFAYAIAKMKFKGAKVLFALVLGVYMLPVAVTYVPCYMILSRMGLLNTHTGLIISWSASIFGVFYLRQNFISQ